MTDISHTLEAKADQLNADDLIGGPIVVQIVDARLVNDEKQPVVVDIGRKGRPWKPCKTMRRLMARVISTDIRQWVGRWVELYNDTSVTYGGRAVGGVRVSAVSGIDSQVTVPLAQTRGRKREWTVRPLQPPVATLDAVLRSTGVTLGQLDDHLVSKGKPPVSQMDDSQRAAIARWLANNANQVKGGGA